MIFIYAKQKIMDRDPTDETTTTDIPGGASRGGDENPEDYKLPGGSSAPDLPVKPPSKLRSMCLGFNN